MIYRLKLIPANAYFFGGETTFGEGELQEYLVHSEWFPKQTTVEGMFKKFLMNKTGSLKIRRRGEWIEKNNENDRSKARKCDRAFTLSPMFVLDGKNTVYVFAPLNDGIVLQKTKGRSFLSGKQIAYSPRLDGYSAKDGLSTSMLSVDGQRQSVFGDDKGALLYQVTQVGITKPPMVHTKDEQKDGFYKKSSYKMAKGFGFGCYIHVADEFIESENFPDHIEETVELGGERSLFMMEMIKMETTHAPMELYRQDYAQALSLTDLEECSVVLSETKISLDDFEKLPYGILSFRSSRHKIRSEVSMKFEKSEKYFMVQPGSVIYAKIDHPNFIQHKPKEN